MKAIALKSLLRCTGIVLVVALTASGASAQINVSQDTFVLSNEGGDGLVSRLLAAGYGNLSLYQVLVRITNDSNPSVGGIITPAFLNVLANSPPSSPILTTHLASIGVGSQAIAISTDGTFQVVNVRGSTYYNQPGTATPGSDVSGVGRGLFTHSVDAGTYLMSWTVSGPLPGMTTTYRVFAIGWAQGTAEAIPLAGAPSLIILAIVLLLLGAGVLRRPS